MKSGEQGGDPQAHLAGSCCAPPPRYWSRRANGTWGFSDPGTSLPSI